MIVVLVAIGGGQAVAALPPMTAAQIELAKQPPDPFEQIMEMRQSRSNGRVANYVIFVMITVLLAVGWYALADRTTKTLRAVKSLKKKSPTTGRRPSSPALTTLPPIQPLRRRP